MNEHELWFTQILNRLFGGPITGLLEAIGIHPKSPAHPIPNHFAMQILVILFVMVLLAWLRASLSAENPGKMQQCIEVVLEFLGEQADDIIGHDGRQFVPFLFTLAVFIFPSNLLGEIPYFETPTGVIEVTLGCALAAFLYYNFWGLRHHGPAGYIKTFMGPVILIAPVMLVIEIISHLARVLSLSVRLYANMLAGDLIPQVFFSLIPVGIPVVFMAFHVFVAVLQTFIFVLLTTVYLSGAVSEGH